MVLGHPFKQVIGFFKMTRKFSIKLGKILMKIFKYVSVAGVVFLATSSAIAGERVGSEVRFSQNSFSGSLGSARSSADSSQYIFCSEGDGLMQCRASDRNRNVKTCFSRNAKHINTIRGISDSSHIRVSYDSSGKCTSVTVINGSFYEPKR
jgi:hypothetical protein